MTEAAKVMGADESTIRKLVVSGELLGYRLGKRGVRIYVSSIQDYQERRAIISTGERKAKAPLPKPRRRNDAAHKEALAGLAALGIIFKPISR
ncbi:DNA-binding protein [Azospirillum brasilense]|uniref:DNA-binding protein n=1 Tax=Azospirillum brasilense TaxID=192 RepID=A0A4D8QY26_AZOBR|nr:helix-turn-helix domain-containing protein [Azospirillum brasilense]QCO14040.1 DNA-binding protein [Azospirillum brasilense]